MNATPATKVAAPAASATKGSTIATPEGVIIAQTRHVEMESKKAPAKKTPVKKATTKAASKPAAKKASTSKPVAKKAASKAPAKKVTSKAPAKKAVAKATPAPKEERDTAAYDSAITEWKTLKKSMSEHFAAISYQARRATPDESYAPSHKEALAKLQSIVAAAKELTRLMAEVSPK